MIQRRVLETAGFITIAAALHVSAAAILMPERLQRGEMGNLGPTALAAGGVEVQSMVSQWENAPEIATPTDLAQPETPPEMQPVPQPEPVEMTALPEAPPALAAPDMPMAAPNLPEAPEPPRIEAAEMNLPEIRRLDPPEIPVEPALTLEVSARPERRPDRSRPEPQQQRAEPRQRALEAPVRQQAQSQPPPQQAGQGGSAPSPNSGGGGAGGISENQRTNLMSQWGGQIRNCISRRADTPRGARGGRVVLALSVGRDGTIHAIAVASSSGQDDVDQSILRAAQRAGRCPAAPAGLTEARYSFQLPIMVQR
ncbi:TonB family protein [Paracoccus bogoriensis]|uniref:TonB family protein n=1 Tax=Paracoccus bogoriensis TaxID=242065 RepID=UPI001CA4A451|nr:TonB family protein [Paracoccus bogoriensis]MBW7057067.1 TonB family protein [Paracoccus bogoriensis]